MRRLVAVLLAFILIVTVPFYSNAAEPAQKSSSDTELTITLEQAQQLALENTSQLKPYYKSIKQLIEPYIGEDKYLYDTEKYSPADRMNGLYSRLVSNDLFFEQDQGELVMYYSMYEGTGLVKNINIDKYMDKNHFPDTSIWYNYVSLKINKEIARYQIIDQVRQLYDNILNVRDQVSIMEKNTQLSENNFKAAQANFNSGSISEINKAEAEENYLTTKLQMEKADRSLQNLENNLKNIIGVQLSQKIALKDYEPGVIPEIQDYDTYLNKALAQRREITVPKMGLVVNQNGLNSLESILRYMPLLDSALNMKNNYENEIQNMQAALEEGKYEVTQDILYEYSQLKAKKSDFDIKSNNFETASKNYNSAKVNFDSGNISKTVFEQINIAKMQADMEYTNSKRVLKYAIDRMEALCGLGVK